MERNTNAKEIKKFIGIILVLGLVQYPDRDTAFSDGPLGCGFITRIMSKSRFDQLMRAFRFQTTYDIFPNMTKAEEKKAKAKHPFWAVKGLATLLASAFNQYFNVAKGWTLMSKAFLGKDAINVDAIIQRNLSSGTSKFLL